MLSDAPVRRRRASWLLPPTQGDLASYLPLAQRLCRASRPRGALRERRRPPTTSHCHARAPRQLDWKRAVRWTKLAIDSTPDDGTAGGGIEGGEGGIALMQPAGR